MPVPTVFLLSPANCSGKRAGLLFRDAAAFPLARRIRSPGGAPLAEVFTFLSGLYFRGKATYARRFARPPVEAAAGVLVITASRGLVDADSPVTLADLREFASVPIDPTNAEYRVPLEASARRLAEVATGTRIVLLGSIATDKYCGILLREFGDGLLFPRAFVGRGDMSRGGLLLRYADDGQELDYVPVAGAVRKGVRPPRLAPRR